MSAAERADAVAAAKTAAPADPVEFETADGWRIHGALAAPSVPEPATDSLPGVAAVLLVPGTKHEHDAYGGRFVRALTALGVASLALDLRGRGRSRGARAFHEMAPRQRARARLDVEAALAHLAADARVDAARLAVVGEQDGARYALEGSAGRDVAAYALVSGRPGPRGAEIVAASAAPVLGLVSKEDRKALRELVAVHAASTHPDSEVRVFEDLGFGTTMFTGWAFLHPDEPAMEQKLAEWLAGRLSAGRAPSAGRRPPGRGPERPRGARGATGG